MSSRAAKRRQSRAQAESTPLLPYQVDWIEDRAPRKISEKSRRVGITYVEAYDAFSARITGTAKHDYWITTADGHAALEFIEECQGWNRLYSYAAQRDDFVERDPETGAEFTNWCIRFPSGAKIGALTSNPRRLRSKGGDGAADEFAHHDDQENLHAALTPVSRWVGQTKIISSHNGETSVFNSIVQKMRDVYAELGALDDRGRPRRVDWATLSATAKRMNVSPVYSYHRVTLQDAIDQGLVERINEINGANQSREDYYDECKSSCLDDEEFLQEYMCVPGVGLDALLPWALIEACEDKGVPNPDEPLTGYKGGYCAIGIDVGRTKDLTVVWVLEPIGDVLWTRQVMVMHNTPMPEQEARIKQLLSSIRWSTVLIDKGHVGFALCDYLQRNVGGDIQGIDFTVQSKKVLATGLKHCFEDRAIRIPHNNKEVRDDLHSVRKVVTASGNVTYVAKRDKNGHADRFWGAALAVNAATAVAGSDVYTCNGVDLWEALR